MNYEIREVREGDLPYLAAHLRGADTREIIATTGNTAILDAITKSVEGSHEVSVCEAEGVPMVIWGLHHLTPTSALIWCLATPLVTQFKLPFVRETRAIFKRWFEEKDTLDHLINFSHAANSLHHRWLRTCGATVLPPVSFGPLHELFSPFVIRRNSYV